MKYAQQTIKTYQKGDVIFRQGDPADCMYDIRSGSVGIYVDYGTPGEKRLTVLGEQDVFGEMGLIEEAPRSAAAVALENHTELVAVSRETFAAYFREQPVKVVRIMQGMSERIRNLTQAYLEACTAITQADEQREESESVKLRFQRYKKEYQEARALIEQHPQLYQDVHSHPWMTL